MQSKLFAQATLAHGRRGLPGAAVAQVGAAERPADVPPSRCLELERAARRVPGRARPRTPARPATGRSISAKTPLAELIARDVDFHRAIYALSGNPAIEEMIAPHWPHMRRSMATVLAELDYRESAWAEHETVAAHIFAGNTKAAEAAALAHALGAGRMTEERLRGAEQAA